MRSLAALATAILFLASLSQAATYRASSTGGDTVGTTDRFAAITPAVGDLLVVFCAVSANSNSTPTASDNNGGAYFLVGAAQFSASAARVSAFVRTTLVANTTPTTVTVATGSNTAGQIIIFAIAGMTRTGAAAIRSSGKQENQVGPSVPAPALNQAALTGNVTLGAVGYNAAPGLTEPTGWTERQDAGQINPTFSIEGVSRDSGFTGTTVTWGSSLSAFGSWIVEIDGSAAATTTLFRNRAGSRARFGSG